MEQGVQEQLILTVVLVVLVQLQTANLKKEALVVEVVAAQVVQLPWESLALTE